jgi:hypothetical protein
MPRMPTRREIIAGTIGGRAMTTGEILFLALVLIATFAFIATLGIVGETTERYLKRQGRPASPSRIRLASRRHLSTIPAAK